MKNKRNFVGNSSKFIKVTYKSAKDETVYREEDKGNVLIRKTYDKVLGKDKIDQILLKNNDYENKDIIQSYIITAAKYDFSVYEGRILLRVIECFQYLLEGKKLDRNFLISENLHGSVTITLPVSSLLLNKKDENYNQIRKALLSLLKKTIEFDNGKIWEAFTLIINPEIIRYNRTVTFQLNPVVYGALLNFSKGYRKYELETAMAFRSIYSIRLYELISGQRKSLTYGIENLKAMFQLGNRYKYIRQFISRVIEPAKKELDLKAPYSFTYELEYEKDRLHSKGGRKKVIGITFTPVYQYKNRDKGLAHKDKSRNLVLSDILGSEEIQAFLSLGFTEQELKDKYYNLFQNINRVRKKGKILINSVIIAYAQKAKNPKTYIIRVLRKEILRWEKGLLAKHTSMDTFKKELENHAYEEQTSVHSFLKNHLGLSGDRLELGMTYVMSRGSKKYLNELVRSYRDMEGKIDDEKIRLHIMNGVFSSHSVSSPSSLLTDTESNGVFHSQKKVPTSDNHWSSEKISKVSTNTPAMGMSHITSDSMISTTEYSIDKDATHLKPESSPNKIFKDDWKKMVIQRLNWKEKLSYALRLYHEDYLKKKAAEKNISLYIDP